MKPSHYYYRLTWIAWWILIICLIADTYIGSIGIDLPFHQWVVTGLFVALFKTFLLLAFAIPMKTKRLKPMNYLSFVSLIYVCAGVVWLFTPTWYMALIITGAALTLFYGSAFYSRSVKREVSESVNKD